jgi:hypothetical protein
MSVRGKEMDLRFLYDGVILRIQADQTRDLDMETA